MDPADPHQWNGYPYGNNSPVTLSDPDGLDPGGGQACEAGHCSPTWGQTGPPPPGTNHAKADHAHDPPPPPTSHKEADRRIPTWYPPSDDVSGNGKGSWNQINGFEYEDGPDPVAVARAADKYYARYYAETGDPYYATVLAIKAVCDQAEVKCGPELTQQLVVEEGLLHNENDPNCGERCQRFAAEVAGYGDIVSEFGGRSGGPGRRGCGSSFDPDTPILMADGTSKPIKDVKAGDVVLATDPVTGKSAPKVVTNTITGAGARVLVDITVDTDGAQGDATGTITATDNHAFWLPELGKWALAMDLQSGSWLRAGSGTWIKVTAIRVRTETATVHNLTVADIHTYYVSAGTVPVLVHNEITDPPENIRKAIELYRRGEAERQTHSVVGEDGTRVVVDDVFDGRTSRRDGTRVRAAARFWEGAEIYRVPGGGNDWRLLVRADGTIGWVGPTGGVPGAGHNYRAIHTAYRPPCRSADLSRNRQPHMRWLRPARMPDSPRTNKQRRFHAVQSQNGPQRGHRPGHGRVRAAGRYVSRGRGHRSVPSGHARGRRAARRRNGAGGRRSPPDVPAAVRLREAGPVGDLSGPR